MIIVKLAIALIMFSVGALLFIRAVNGENNLAFIASGVFFLAGCVLIC